MKTLVMLLVFWLTTGPAQADDRPGVYLGDLSWPAAAGRLAEAPVVVLPFGAGAKEHGPHLPMNADRRVMEYLLERAIESQPVIVAPPILHGWFPAFRDFPGTEVADPVVFQEYVMAVAMSLIRHGARRLVILNTGIGKATGLPLSIVAREIRTQTGTPTLVVSWDDLETDAVAAIQEQEKGGHSDEIETSILLYLAPDSVDMSRAVTDYGPHTAIDFGGYRPGLFSRDPSDPGYSETGVFGDPRLATTDKGRKALEIMTRAWLEALEGFADTPRRGD